MDSITTMVSPKDVETEALERRRDRVAMMAAGRLAAGAYIDVAELTTIEARIRKQVGHG